MRDPTISRHKISTRTVIITPKISFAPYLIWIKRLTTFSRQSIYRPALKQDFALTSTLQTSKLHANLCAL